MRRLVLLVALLAACEEPLSAPAPAPMPALARRPALPPNVVGGALRFLDRQGDVQFRNGEIAGVGVSGNGRFAASASVQATAAAWDLASGRLLVWLDTPHVSGGAVAISDDGTRLATSGGDGTTRMWDVSRGRQLWESKLDADRLRFTADGKYLIGGRLHDDRAWTSDGRLLHRDARPLDVIALERGVAVSDDLLSVAALEPIATWSDREVNLTSIAVAPRRDRVGVLGTQFLDVFSADGTHVASVRIAGRLRVSERTGVALSEDPRYAATWDDELIVAWDIPANREVWRVREAKLYGAPQLASGGVLIISAGGRCIGRDIADGRELWRRDACVHARALPSTTTVVLERGASALDAVEARTGVSLLGLPPATGPLAPVDALAISRDGKHIVGHASQLWAWAGAAAHRLVDPPTQLWRPTLLFLASGRLAVVSEGMLTAYVHRYDVDRNAIEASRELRRPERLGGTGVWFGERLIVDEVREHDYRLTIFDLADREAPRTLPVWSRPANQPHMAMRNESLNDAVADPVARRMFVVGENNHIHAWDLGTGRLVARGAESNGFTRQLVLTPDRKHLIVPRDRGPIVMLDTAKLREERRFDGPHRHVTMAAVSPDGTLVAASAYDGLYLWRLADGARVATVDFTPAHEAPTSIAFAPDGTTLWVGTDIGTMLRFHVGR
jgi:WD40 repeat protein